MALPIAPNTTCDIYRTGNSPPSAPDVASVPCRLDPYIHARPMTDVMQTHILQVDYSVDVRDNFPTTQDGTGGDKVYVPDQNGVLYRVALVKRQNRGTSTDSKYVLLRRQSVTWPSNDV